MPVRRAEDVLGNVRFMRVDPTRCARPVAAAVSVPMLSALALSASVSIAERAPRRSDSVR